MVGGTLAALLGPAAQTYVVDVVGRKRTDHAISLNAIGGSVGTIGGAALAGLLIKELGVVSTYFAAAAGVVLAGLLLLTIPIPGHAERKERTSLRSDLVEGLAYVRARPHLLLALAACAMALFNGAISPMRVIYARHVFGAGADAFGMMSVFHGGGTMLGAVFLTLRAPRRGPPRGRGRAPSRARPPWCPRAPPSTPRRRRTRRRRRGSPPSLRGEA